MTENEHDYIIVCVDEKMRFGINKEALVPPLASS